MTIESAADLDCSQGHTNIFCNMITETRKSANSMYNITTINRATVRAKAAGSMS